MTPLTDRERQLLERLAAEGKQTRPAPAEIEAGKLLEMAGLVFVVRDTAVITPKGRQPSLARASARDQEEAAIRLPGVVTSGAATVNEQCLLSRAQFLIADQTDPMALKIAALTQARVRAARPGGCAPGHSGKAHRPSPLT